MSLFRRETVPVDKVGTLEGLKPLKDDVFSYLLERAAAGEADVYFAAVPMGLVDPFDTEYRPQDHPIGAAAIDQIFKAWQAGEYQPCWVYPRNGRFILSDDYISFAAALRGDPESLPCWVIGLPEHPDVKDVQGPIELGDVRELLGLSRTPK